jgi:hypothetical protein
MDEMNDQKVYCGDCKFYRYDSTDYGDSEICRSNLTQQDTYYEVKVRFADPRVKNKNNNCKEFETKTIKTGIAKILQELWG